MKISIIMATYNRASTLPRALASFQSQSYGDKQCVMIDACSSDGSIESILPRLMPGDRLVREPDDGIYDALNKGLTECDGDVVGVLHSDDFFAGSEVLSRVMRIFSTDNPDIVYGDASFFSADNPEKVQRLYKSGAFSRTRLASGFMPAHTAMFFRREVFEKFGKYKVDYEIAADYEFLCRVSDKGLRYQYLPEVFVRMQLGGKSTKNVRSTIVLNREVLRACRQNGIDTNMPKILMKYPKKIWGALGVSNKKST